MNNILNKETIFSKVDSYALINQYLKPYHNFGELKKGQHISNPFLAEKQKTPSFNIYKSSMNLWRYKDFATDDDGDVFELIMKLKKCSFMEALVVINNDFMLGLDERKVQVQFEIQTNNWDDAILNYWKEYGVEVGALNHFGVLSLENFKRIDKNGKENIVISTKGDPIYVYQINNYCYKIYRPYSVKYKFSWLGNKPKNYVFGFEQLPKSGDRVFITGGEKDVISLYAKKQNAICLNSETAIPSIELIDKLKSNFKEVTVLYDIDNTGMSQSKKMCINFGLERMVLPEKLKNEGGKDISDFFKLGYLLTDKEIIIENYADKKLINDSKHLNTLLKTQKKLSDIKSEIIIHSIPILIQLDQEMIHPRTINMIQGKAGVHKSRIAETMASALIKTTNCKNKLLEFESNYDSNLTVCYVDTERNLTEQFPYALQQILRKAGYSIGDTPANFDYISLLEIDRTSRFEALSEYLELIRLKYKGHTVIILDVVTDCIRDFNRAEDSLQLIDLMNVFINKYDVTFICLIHENPGSIDKARGHLGTELYNKSSTVIQVGFETGKGGKPSNIIVLKFLKKRSTKRFDPIHLIYSEEHKGLVLADSDMVDKFLESRLLKADPASLIKFIENDIVFPIFGKELIDSLSIEFDCCDKIIRERLNKFINDKIELINGDNTSCYLIKKKEGREVIYDIKPIN